MGFVVVIGHMQLSSLTIGAAGALATISHLIIFLSLLKIGRKVCTCVGMTPVKSFLNQTTHVEVIIE